MAKITNGNLSVITRYELNPDRKLIELRNLGAASVNILKTIGINTCGDLQKTGSVTAYRLIRQRGLHASRALLYAMEGALQDIPWQSLDPALKVQLVQMADRIDQEETDAQKPDS